MKASITRSGFILFSLILLICSRVFAQDTFYIKVHFLYGSKPARGYKHAEEKWFGGILGGHVGIETDSNKVLDFVPDGKLHWFAHHTTCTAALFSAAHRNSGKFSGVKKVRLKKPPL